MAKYANFSLSKFKDVKISKSNLESATLENVKFKNIKFYEDNLMLVNLFNTDLNNIDFTNSNIEGITLNLKDRRGAIVNEMQAIELAKILGIRVK